MRRRVLRTLSVAVGVTAILVGTQTAAQAETRGGTSTWQEVQQDTAAGYCRAEVQLYSNNYARAFYYNDHAGWNCTMLLERSTNNGATWSSVAGTAILQNLSGAADLASTGEYWDGPGYLARACFHLNFAGAAEHCTYAV
ncbi:hypothetical protein OG555_25955 [Kribbella sp. NBC_01484]|uniref:hypothetical protein n=1 Tax=Kribbella sp. NBC_01484 TaxID=2903579 RepID=UPI002E339218|nr:hypothetical protein [Kribbella sp. NBC_01484]